MISVPLRPNPSSGQDAKCRLLPLFKSHLNYENYWLATCLQLTLNQFLPCFDTEECQRDDLEDQVSKGDIFTNLDVVLVAPRAGETGSDGLQKRGQDIGGDEHPVKDTWATS